MRGGASLRDCSDYGGSLRLAVGDIENREDCNGEQEVRHWAGQDDQEALPDGPMVEAPPTLLRRQCANLAGHADRAHVADKLHVAAERQPADLPACAPFVGPAGDLAAKSNREAFRPNAEDARDEVMAKLVKEDEWAQRRQEGDQDKPDGGLGEHQLASNGVKPQK